jgi:TatD DNase family protein
VRLIDSHCHLDRLELNPSQTLDSVLNDARGRGVCHFLNIGVERETHADVVTIAEKYNDVSCTVGIHPLYEGIHQHNIEWLNEAANHAKIVAIGETGLDYYYNRETAEAQQKSFRAHIQVAWQKKLPLVIHTRMAQEDTLTIMREERAQEVGGVLHCFTETWAMAEKALDLGFYISLSGIVTFRNAAELREVAKKVPLDRLLVETDSPWLAPVPHRGKTNLPTYVVDVAQCVAKERGISINALANATTENFFRLFSRAKQL